MGITLHMPTARQLQVCAWATVIGAGLTILTGLVLLFTSSPSGFWSPYPITTWAITRIVLGVLCLAGVAVFFFGLTGPATVCDIRENIDKGYVINGSHFACSCGVFLFLLAATAVGVRFAQLLIIRSGGLPPGCRTVSRITSGIVADDGPTFLVVGEKIDSFVVWDLRNRRKVLDYDSWWASGITPYCASVSSRGGILATGFMVGFRVMDCGQGKELAELKPAGIQLDGGALCLSSRGSKIVFAGGGDSSRSDGSGQRPWRVTLCDFAKGCYEEVARCSERVNKLVFAENEDTIYGGYVSNRIPRIHYFGAPPPRRTGEGLEGNVVVFSRQAGAWGMKSFPVGGYLVDFVVDRSSQKVTCLTAGGEVVRVDTAAEQNEHLGRVTPDVRVEGLATCSDGRILVCGTRAAEGKGRVVVVVQINGTTQEFAVSSYIGEPDQTWLSADGRTLIVGGPAWFCTFDL